MADGGAKKQYTKTPTMKISQLGLVIDLELVSSTRTLTYTGLANRDAKKSEKGQLALLFCGTDDRLGASPDHPFFDELGTMSVSTKPPKVKASLKGSSIFSNERTLPAAAGTCKWKWTRTSTADPGVVRVCGGLALTLPPTAP